MAIFDKINVKPSASNETTTIASGAKIDGVFNCDSRLHVDGEIVGDIYSKSVVIIGKSGKINGKIIANRLVVNGVFEGNADCDIIEILTGGKFIGKVITKELIIEEKARFEGESKMKEDHNAPKMITEIFPKP
ncbi:MAG: polymer-forming cytoskeletal protein [Sulfurospirillum sp.]|nr:polymer-forming cytoskeletal protein [Sulfurospirillum sp.]MBL0702363.1 polymer-forming cytoskeletal protein [Sulfurospirillum sp.]